MSGEAVLGDGRVLPDWTMTHLVRARAREHGERVFATFGGGAALTFAGLDRESDRFAAALAVCGIGPGERVMALLGNGPEILIAFFGAMKAGALIVPVNIELRGAFLAHQVDNAAPAMVVAEAGLVQAFDGVEGSARLAIVETRRRRPCRPFSTMARSRPSRRSSPRARAASLSKRLPGPETSGPSSTHPAPRGLPRACCCRTGISFSCLPRPRGRQA